MLHGLLVLLLRLAPPRPSNLSVRAWRPLRRCGAVGLKSAPSPLADTGDRYEPFRS